MLFHVKMTVKLPVDMDPQQAERLKAEEKEMAQRLQREGSWRHLWRIAGHYANYSLFDLPSVEALHDTLLAHLRDAAREGELPPGTRLLL